MGIGGKKILFCLSFFCELNQTSQCQTHSDCSLLISKAFKILKYRKFWILAQFLETWKYGTENLGFLLIF
jgi:hypothetical protein